MKSIVLALILAVVSCTLSTPLYAQTEASVKKTRIGLLSYPFPSTPPAAVRSEQTTPIRLFEIHQQHLRSDPLRDVLTEHVSLISLEPSFQALYENIQESERIQLWIPVEEGLGIQLDLSPQWVVAEQFLVHTSQGERQRGTGNLVPHYMGKVLGDPKSIVSLSVFKGTIRIMISTSTGNFNLVKILGQEEQYLLFNDQHVKQYRPFLCGTADGPGPYTGTPTDGELIISTRARNRVEVYIEVDFDAYQANGSSVNATRDWVLGIFRDMASIYERHAISIRLNEIFIWTTNNDPFNGIGADFGKLDTALTNWSAVQTTFNGDVAHYMGTESGGGFVIGLANSIGEFCDKIGGFADPDGSSHCSTMGNSIPYVQLDNTTSQMVGFDVPTWTMLGNLHELGHIFGANHTHACKWGPAGTSQLDDCGNQWAITNGVDDDGNGLIDDINDTEGASCFFAETPIIPSNGGTLMSYCNFTFVGAPEINLSEGFHSEVSARMRSIINASSCIGNYNTSCPEIETIELDFSGTWDASEDVSIHDSEVLGGNSALVTAGNQVILYGNFVCPLNASIQISGNGCSN